MVVTIILIFAFVIFCLYMDKKQKKYIQDEIDFDKSFDDCDNDNNDNNYIDNRKDK